MVMRERVSQVISAQEFLRLRQRITHDDVVLAQFDDQLRHMCARSYSAGGGGGG